MISWRNVYGSGAWLKGRNSGDGATFRAFQIIDRSGGEIFGDCPRGQPWELLATGGGHRSETTYHASRRQAITAAIEINSALMRTLQQALADHGIFYTLHVQRSGARRVALHSVKGFLGYFHAVDAWELVHQLEESGT